MSILILFISAGVLFKGTFSLWVSLKINFPNPLSVFSCFMNCNNVFGTSCVSWVAFDFYHLIFWQQHILHKLSHGGVLQKAALKNFPKFTGKPLCRSFFLIKLQAVAQKRYYKETPAQLLYCKLCDFFRVAFIENLWKLLLIFVIWIQFKHFKKMKKHFHLYNIKVPRVADIKLGFTDWLSLKCKIFAILLVETACIFLIYF